MREGVGELRGVRRVVALVDEHLAPVVEGSCDGADAIRGTVDETRPADVPARRPCAARERQLPQLPSMRLKDMMGDRRFDKRQAPHRLAPPSLTQTRRDALLVVPPVLVTDSR